MQRKIIVSILFSVVAVLLALGVISHLSVNNSIERALADRLEMARIIANYTDYLLENNLARLYDLSLSGAMDFSDGDWGPEKKALKRAYQYSLFTDGIFLVGPEGRVVLAYPPGRDPDSLIGIPFVMEALKHKQQVISDIHTMRNTGRKVLFVLVPLKDGKGQVIGIAGGEINPTTYILNRIIRAIPAADETFIELVDSSGTVIASNKPGRIFTSSDHDRFLENLIAKKKTAVTRCHRCHTSIESKAGGGAAGGGEKDKRTLDMLAFAPLSGSSWGVLVREPGEQVFAPSTGLKQKFLLLAVISIASALMLALGMSRSIVKPIRQLIKATERISTGNLEEPVNIDARDEIGALGEGFEAMRAELSKSLKRIHRHRDELELKVAERTQELEENKKRLAVLLKQVITAQEDERKRIARELHDETSQNLAALGMSLEIASMAHRQRKLDPMDLQQLQGRVTQALEGLNMIIRDLRPPVLDDLGLESAIRWLLQRHLDGKGIACSLTFSNTCATWLEGRSNSGEFEKAAELMLFRVIQEAIANIAKHSGASLVSAHFSLTGRSLHMALEDNGKGFDIKAAMLAPGREKGAGFGLLGMRERMAILGGSLDICSDPGHGTMVVIEAPLSAFGKNNA